MIVCMREVGCNAKVQGCGLGDAIVVSKAAYGSGVAIDAEGGLSMLRLRLLGVGYRCTSMWQQRFRSPAIVQFACYLWMRGGFLVGRRLLVSVLAQARRPSSVGED